MITRLRAIVRRLPTADRVALAYAVTYFVWMALHTPGTAVNNVIADAAFFPLGLAMAWLFWRNARMAARLGLGLRTQAAWSLLAAAAITLWISGNGWTYFVVLTGPAHTPGWIDGLEYLQLSLTIAACAALPGRELLPGTRVRFSLDVALMLVAAGALAFHYGTAVVAPVPNLGRINLVVVRATLDWGVFFALAVGVFHKRDHTTRVVVTCLLGANICVLAGNWLLSALPTYRAGNPVDALWFGAWMLKWTAARYAWHQYRRHQEPLPRVGDEGAVHHGGALPHVVVAAAFGLLIYQVLTGPRSSIPVFAFSAVTMAGLLLGRQVAELRASRRLFESLAAQEARFRSLVQNSSDVVLVVDGSGRVSYVSPSVARVLGEGAVDVGARLADLVPADDVSGLAPLFDGSPHAVNRLQSRMHTATGEWREIEIVATDLRLDPAVDGIVLNCRDVSDRNELERQLHHAQKLDAVGHLAGGLAHDFNNVLTAIRGYAELLRDEIPETSNATTDLLHIEQAVDRAAAVTKKLLAFSRKQAVQRVVFNLNTVLLDLAPLLRQLLTDRIEVCLEPDPALWPIKADPGQMEQVIINLATNARDAMPDGGQLQMATANRTVTTASVETGALVPGDYIALVVSDQGTGMRDETRNRIFEPFFTTKARDRGMGLGLAMVHGIVTHAGGHIAVETSWEHGTTFTILIPRTQEATQEGSSTAAPAAPGREARRVLLVDDELGVRTIARRMLERAGYTVIEATGGVEALDALTRDRLHVDLLLTDMVMPGLHGRDLIARFRELRPGVPVVCITGFAGETPEAHGHGDGISAVVTKPFSSEVLLRAVDAACAPYGSTEEIPGTLWLF
jgi:PAS domain S-box-containing protein